MYRKDSENEIKTIRPRTITLNLSDADCERLAEAAGSVNLKISELLENFIGDLVDGTCSNGSDERMMANEWFERCGFSMFPEESFIAFLIEYSLTDDFLMRLEILNDHKSDLEECEKNIGNLSEEEKAEILGIKEEIEWQQENLKEIYEEYTNSTKTPVPYEKALQQVLEWEADKNALRDENE